MRSSGSAASRFRSDSNGCSTWSSSMRQKKITTAFSAKKIGQRIDALGKQIRKDTGPSEVFLLGILKGTSCFLADLVRAIPGDVTYGFIDVVRDVADAETANALEIDYFSYTDI